MVSAPIFCFAVLQPTIKGQQRKVKDHKDTEQEEDSSEISFNSEGKKVYTCLLCGREFGHPPAFAKHKGAHARAGEYGQEAASKVFAEEKKQKETKKQLKIELVRCYLTETCCRVRV